MIWKFYFKLINGLLPSYFNIMIPVLPPICNFHEVRKPIFHLPHIIHEFAEQLIHFQLIRQLNNETGALLISSKVHTHSFLSFKLYIKTTVINNYKDRCEKMICYSCLKRVRNLSE